MRLNELGLLTMLTRISSVSGGSIATGMLAAHWPRLAVKDGIISNLLSDVIQPLRAFCKRSIDASAIGWGIALPGKGIGAVLADSYDTMFNGMTLAALPDRPQFVFNATNLQTGRLVRMQKIRLADYSVGIMPNPKIKLAVAVAASSAFPPFLSPVEIRVDPVAWHNSEGAKHYGDPAYSRVLALTDGGAYDNLGLETVDDFNPVIVSDAGAPFGTEERRDAFWPKQVLRALDIATDQSRAMRKRLLFAECRAQKRTAVYAGIDGDPTEYPAEQNIGVNPAVTAALARMRTRLNPFSDDEQGRLINWGWLMMDVAIRSYLLNSVPAPKALPIPKYPLA